MHFIHADSPAPRAGHHETPQRHILRKHASAMESGDVLVAVRDDEADQKIAVSFHGRGAAGHDDVGADGERGLSERRCAGVIENPGNPSKGGGPLRR